jgi:hypothetical protein
MVLDFRHAMRWQRPLSLRGNVTSILSAISRTLSTQRAAAFGEPLLGDAFNMAAQALGPLRGAPQETLLLYRRFMSRRPVSRMLSRQDIYLTDRWWRGCERLIFHAFLTCATTCSGKADCRALGSRRDTTQEEFSLASAATPAPSRPVAFWRRGRRKWRSRRVTPLTGCRLRRSGRSRILTGACHRSPSLAAIAPPSSRHTVVAGLTWQIPVSGLSGGHQ